MHMWVKVEFLTPGVQHAEEANFCAKMLGIAGNFEQCFCTGSEQEIVDDLLILKSQWANWRGSVKTTCTYCVGRSSLRRFSSQRSRAPV